MYSLFQGHKCKIHIFFFHPFVNQTKIFIISHFLSFLCRNTPKKMVFFSPFPQLQPQLKCLLKTPICAKFTICFLKKWRFETMIAQPILKNSRVTQKTRFRAMVLAFLTSFIATPSPSIPSLLSLTEAPPASSFVCVSNGNTKIPASTHRRPTPSLSRQVSFFFRHFGLLILYDVL